MPREQIRVTIRVSDVLRKYMSNMIVYISLVHSISRNCT